MWSITSSAIFILLFTPNLVKGATKPLSSCGIKLFGDYGNGYLPLTGSCPDPSGGDIVSELDINNCFAFGSGLSCSEGGGFISNNNCDRTRCEIWGTTLSCLCFPGSNQEGTYTIDMSGCLSNVDGYLTCFSQTGGSIGTVAPTATKSFVPTPSPSPRKLNNCGLALDSNYNNGYIPLDMTCPDPSGGDIISQLDINNCFGFSDAITCTNGGNFISNNNCDRTRCEIYGTTLSCYCWSSTGVGGIYNIDMSTCLNYFGGYATCFDYTGSSIGTISPSKTKAFVPTPSPAPRKLSNCGLALGTDYNDGYLPLDATCPDPSGGDTISLLDINDCFSFNDALTCSNGGNFISNNYCDRTRCETYGTTLSCWCTASNGTGGVYAIDMSACVTYFNNGLATCYDYTAQSIGTVAASATKAVKATPSPVPRRLSTCGLFLDVNFNDGWLPMDATCPDPSGGDTVSLLDLNGCFAFNNGLSCSNGGNFISNSQCDRTRCEIYKTVLSCWCTNSAGNGGVYAIDMSGCVNYFSNGLAYCFDNTGSSISTISASATKPITPTPSPSPRTLSNCSPLALDPDFNNGWLPFLGTCPDSTGGKTKSELDINGCLSAPNGVLKCANQGNAFSNNACDRTQCTFSGTKLTCPCSNSAGAMVSSTIDLNTCVGYFTNGQMICFDFTGTSIGTVSPTSATATATTTIAITTTTSRSTVPLSSSTTKSSFLSSTVSKTSASSSGTPVKSSVSTSPSLSSSTVSKSISVVTTVKSSSASSTSSKASLTTTIASTSLRSTSSSPGSSPSSTARSTTTIASSTFKSSTIGSSSTTLKTSGSASSSASSKASSSISSTVKPSSLPITLATTKASSSSSTVKSSASGPLTTSGVKTTSLASSSASSKSTTTTVKSSSSTTSSPGTSPTTSSRTTILPSSSFTTVKTTVPSTTASTSVKATTSTSGVCSVVTQTVTVTQAPSTVTVSVSYCPTTTARLRRR